MSGFNLGNIILYSTFRIIGSKIKLPFSLKATLNHHFVHYLFKSVVLFAFCVKKHMPAHTDCETKWQMYSNHVNDLISLIPYFLVSELE